jgi:PadR family transcriptional regulator, regulatory protein AphA
MQRTVKSKSIRLTTTSYALLALLEQLGESTPYEIKAAMEESLENFWPVPHTTAYEEPARLAKAGYLAVRQEEGGRRRKAYSVTELGREALAAWAADPEVSPPQLRDETMLKIFAGADPALFAAPREEWHRAKLAELQGYLEEVRDEEDWAPSRPVLLAGVGYHRKMLELIEELRGR